MEMVLTPFSIPFYAHVQFALMRVHKVRTSSMFLPAHTTELQK